MKVIITAGGTGGHIYPALAVLDEIKRDPKNKYLYIGTTNRMESEIIPKEGIPYEGIEIYGLSKNIVKNVKNVRLTLKSYKKCKQILSDFKPDIVLAFGGFVTLPVCKAASSLNIPYILHEQNKLPGKTNMYLSKNASRVFTSFEESGSFKCKKERIIYSGNPAAQRGLEIKQISKENYGFNKDKKLVIIVMGSQGSDTANERMFDFLRTYERDDIEILFIAGKNSYKQIGNNLITPKSTKIVEYVDKLPGLIKSSDLVITRAGAGIMSELLALKTPSILVPSPYVANNHQYFNALEYVNKGISLMIEEANLNTETITKTLEELLEDNKYKEIKENLRKIKYPMSSSVIYEEIIKVIKE